MRPEASDKQFDRPHNLVLARLATTVGFDPAFFMLAEQAPVDEGRGRGLLERIGWRVHPANMFLLCSSLQISQVGLGPPSGDGGFGR